MDRYLRRFRYAPIETNDKDDEHLGDDTLVSFVERKWKANVLLTALAISSCIACMSCTFIAYHWHRGAPDNPLFPQALYSPAGGIISYHVVRFTQGEGGELTKYQAAPSDDVDKEWAALYDINAQIISTAEANKMENFTFPVPERRNQHIVMLSVFHQLHCLDNLRKALHPEYYREEDDPMHLNYEHYMHCIDSLRQSLMCFSDVTPIPFAWDQRVGHVQHHETIRHTCRNFDLIRDWAADRAMESGLSWVDFPRPGSS